MQCTVHEALPLITLVFWLVLLVLVANTVEHWG